MKSVEKWACTAWLDAGVSLYSCVYVHSPTLPLRTGRDVRMGPSKAALHAGELNH